ncbi:hypothetical protein BGX26_001828 [Mortierella sp. AD094]|nr:hypothetical protein BGX26_001828 [Mortierella sp. AD094]
MSDPRLIGYEKEAEEFSDIDFPKISLAVRESVRKAQGIDPTELHDWRAKMLADDPQKRFKRWYNVINQGAFFGKVGLDDTIEQAVPVTIEDSYMVSLGTLKIPPGLYDVVLCISLDGLDIESVKSIHFMFSIDLFKSETVLFNEEIAAIHYVVVGAGKPRQTIDVWHKNEQELDPERPVKIQQYAVAASGSHVATLSYTENHVHVDLWTLLPTNSAGTFPCFDSIPCAQVTIPWLPGSTTAAILGVSTMQDLGISLSLKATQIALFSTQVSEGTMPFSVFDYNNNASIAVAIANPTDNSTVQQLEPSTKFRTGKGLEGLVDFIGFGKFHDTAEGEQDEKNERFIACDGLSVMVYSTFGAWEHIYTLNFKVERRPGQDRLMIDSVRSKYFAWLGHKNAMSIWDIDSGTFVSYLDLPKRVDGIYSIEFSKDGSIMALAHPFGITTYQTDSGIECKSFLPENLFEANIHIHFIQGDSRMMLQTPQRRKDVGPGYHGYILDTHNLVEIEPFHITVFNGYAVHRASVGENQLLSTCLGSKLDVIALKDVLVKPVSPMDEKCSDLCLKDRMSTAASGNNMEHETPNGLRFKIQIRPTIRFQGMLDLDLFSIALNVESPDVPPRDILLIAPAEQDDISKLHLQFKATGILKARDQIFLLTDLYIQIWGLPETADGACELVALWRLQSSSVDHKQTFKHYATFTTCRHQRQFFMDLRKTMNPSDPLDETLTIAPSEVFSLEHSTQFLEGLPFLMETYRSVDARSQVAIFMYLGKHINSYPNPAKLETSLMTAFCHQWKPEDHKHYTSFFQSMMSSKHVRWIPRKDYTKESNPIMVLLSKVRTDRLAIDLVVILVNYCFERAERKKNIHFLRPLFQCMDDLIDLCPDIALDICRRAAFIPTRNRTLVIDNHRVILAPSFCQYLTKFAPLSDSTSISPGPLPLTEYVDPILQFQVSTAKHSSLHDKFTHEIFEASFDMLWGQQRETASSKGADPVRETTWLKTIFYLMTSWWRVRKYVQVYDYGLEYFDNPAVEALVEYKWNTFGFTLWLARFSMQCVYYLLIILSALLQVYYDQPSDLFGVFVAIAVLAAVFLWLEFLQCVKNWRRYIVSPYNVLDLAFFELRINKTVFVLMINFLIALVNIAFSKGDESWRLVLLDNRLRYVENAENLSFHIPGFRKTHDWFPKHIYYTAPAARVKEYRDKFRKKEDIPTIEKMSTQVSKLLEQLQRIQDRVSQSSPILQAHLGDPQLEHRPDDGYDSEASDLDTQLMIGRRSRFRTDRRAAIAQVAELIPRSAESTSVQAAGTSTTKSSGDSKAPKATDKDASIRRNTDESTDSRAAHVQEQEPSSSRANNTVVSGTTLSTEEVISNLAAPERSEVAAHRRIDGDQMLLQLMLEIRQLKDQVSGLTAGTQRQSALMQEIFETFISHMTRSPQPSVPRAEGSSSDN